MRGQNPRGLRELCSRCPTGSIVVGSRHDLNRNERAPFPEDGPPGVHPSTVWVVIPSYNDEGAIDGVLASLEPYGYSVVVVDDGSKQPLADHLASRWVHLCSHLVNLGQGAALQTGIDYALLHGAKYVVTFDADGQHSAGDIPRLLDALTMGGCDVASWGAAS